MQQLSRSAEITAGVRLRLFVFEIGQAAHLRVRECYFGCHLASRSNSRTAVNPIVDQISLITTVENRRSSNRELKGVM